MSAGTDLPDIEDMPDSADLVKGRSAVDRIRQRHARRRQYLDLAIPEWEGDVVARFARMPKKVLLAATKGKGNAARSNAKLLANCCQEIFILNEAGDLEPASNADEASGPVRFDGRLVDLFELGQDAVEPADIVVRMYADDIAIGAHVKKILDWQTGEDLNDLPTEEVEEEAGGF